MARSREKYRTPGKRRRRNKGSGGLFQRRDGMWIGRVEIPNELDPKRYRSEVYSRDKAVALEKLEQLKLDIANGLEQLQRGWTVESWTVHWIDEIKKQELGPNVWRTYRSTIRQQIIPSIGPVRLADLNPAHIRHLLDYVRLATVEKEIDGQIVAKPRWSSRTVQVAYDRIKEALDAAGRERPPLMRENVAKLVPRPAAVYAEIPHHTADQARTVLSTAIERTNPYVSLLAARYLTAMRQGELLGLEEDRIDFEALTIDKSWQLQWLPLREGMKYSDDPDRYDAPKHYEIRPLYFGAALVRPKTRKSILIPMAPELAAILQAYLEHRTPNDYGLMWVSPAGKPIRPADDTAVWTEALEAAGVPVIPGHGGRHTANNLLDIPEEDRMRILGQSSVVANRIYRKVDLERAREGMGEFSRLLLPQVIVPTRIRT
ncbi:site-specific integrase [Nocardia sp. CNY236]|uniref:tyrosine-type recombinase/integrase n=1 Tax=Nocardia sp. CNY236 TaxID=1169152 RepID=UPI0003FAF08A|nr:site-specific integrase [Nocardia sp. CNY236]